MQGGIWQVPLSLAFLAHNFPWLCSQKQRLSWIPAPPTMQPRVPQHRPHTHPFHPALSSFLCRQQRLTHGSLPHTGTCLTCLIRDLGPEIRCLIYPQLPSDPSPYRTTTSSVQAWLLLPSQTTFRDSSSNPSFETFDSALYPSCLPHLIKSFSRSWGCSSVRRVLV